MITPQRFKQEHKNAQAGKLAMLTELAGGP
jgi:hypothetical protein